MKPLGLHNYFVYIVTNATKTVLYVGVTNNLRARLYQHMQDAITDKLHFTGKYNAYFLVYWERFDSIEDAISREKQLKGWRRSKKEALISEFNPEWRFLNDEV
ncbi:GIY-YIG nuclease family protein [Tenuifilum thalassicum]|uniref:GIY-YIG nuclease family protein n=1 Tax=Tenuifilum thalassicum TaxID=2590900 RepID=A0A7D4BFP1_9BACT|nr:GIY-YIG nuclease family protein [Tenuifilum thalassicum]QKG80798.1 GIY-YIG nuclease family protein [Tenuifilum thalassicum]